jgi:GNAT superfamily N-acetyltransferase
MNFEIIPACDIPLAEQAIAFNVAFAGYLVPLAQMDAAALARFLCGQGADLCYSRFVRMGGNLIAFGYVNRTGNISRLSAMGTIPNARRSGAAAHLLSQLLKEAKARQDQAMVLEVFEQNLPALALYRRYGFAQLSRLFGWRRPATVGPPQQQADAINEIRLIDAIQLPNAFEFPNLPWQISRHSVAKLAAARAFGSERACAVIGDTTMQPTRIHGFFAVEKNWNELTSILGSVIQQFPNSEFLAVAIFPEVFGNTIFEPLGFVREPLNQLLMRRDL